MTTGDARKSVRIVRMYSVEVDERLPVGHDAHRLGQVLNQGGGDIRDVTEPWRKFFKPWESVGSGRDPITEVIEVESTKLREKWVTFQNNSPKEDRLELQKYEPTVEGVVDMVDDITVNWQVKRGKGKTGKAMTLFHKFCRTLNSHRTLMQMMPEGNEYVSVFTGALNSIIRASANYERIAEGLSEGLCSISEHITDMQGDLELFRTEAMLKLVADLYEHIFLFLSSTMDWIMEKRRRKLLDSFNESFNERFEKEITAINAKAERIGNKAAQISRAETRSARETLESLDRDVRLGLNGKARHQAEMRLFAERLEQELMEAKQERRLEGQRMRQLSTYVKLLLEERATGWVAGYRVTEMETGVPFLSMLTAGSRHATKRTADEVATLSSCLEDFFSRSRVRLTADMALSIEVRPETLSRLAEWTEGQSSGVLWLEGPPNEVGDLENPITLLATAYVNLIAGSRLPVLSYFVELGRDEKLREDNTPELQGMVAVVYALVRQMIELLLPEFESEADLSEQRFKTLDGTTDSWQDALSVLRELLVLMPDTVFCVIDGLHWLDDGSTDTPLRELIQLLRADKIRLLLTTSGRAGCLLEELSAEETVQVSDRDRGAYLRVDA